MSITRRTFLLGSAAAAATGAVSASAIARAAMQTRANRISAVSSPGDVIGKVSVGYQGWFAASGDSAPINGWWHWAHDWGRAPDPDNNAIKSWPDMREYARQLGAFPNGRVGPAVFELRPGHGQCPLPLDAGARHRHRGSATLQSSFG
jgi:hypothetical protein